MQTSSSVKFLKKNTMVIALVLVIIIFSITTGGKILLPQTLQRLQLHAAAGYGSDRKRKAGKLRS